MLQVWSILLTSRVSFSFSATFTHCTIPSHFSLKASSLYNPHHNQLTTIFACFDDHYRIIRLNGTAGIIPNLWNLVDDVENSLMAKGVFARTIWVVIRENLAPCFAPIIVQFKLTRFFSNVPWCKKKGRDLLNLQIL